MRRRGFLFEKVEAVDGKGEVVGRHKPKRFRISGCYHVCDKDGKHIAESRGKLFEEEFTVYAPDGKTELGKMSHKRGGTVKELLSPDGTYGVQFHLQFADDRGATIMILDGAVALDTLLKKHHHKKGHAKGEGAGEERGKRRRGIMDFSK